MNVKIDAGAKCPTKAHYEDAGYDIFARETKVVPAHGSAVFDTGVHFEIPIGCVGFLKSKSGLNVKHGITSEGVIDCGYTGSVCVKLYNNSDEDYEVNCGDKISQIVFLISPHFELNIVDEIKGSKRGDKGFGSSGR